MQSIVRLRIVVPQWPLPLKQESWAWNQIANLDSLTLTPQK